ncbi:MAG: [protein-PII] uridylyltransferase [Pseudomonadota bacterium]
MFDFSALDQALKQSSLPVSAFKETLAAGSSLILDQFEKLPIAELVSARAQLIDEILRRSWSAIFTDSGDVSLVAVGGFGRGELHPASDIDLMILLGHEDHFAQLKEQLEQFLTLLWDIGLEVGQSVRTIEDCIREAGQDISVITNLVESRLLAGSATLFNEMQIATASDKMWNSHDFFTAKWREQRNRHAKYDDSVSNLEPNIKESPGGLRDIQMIGWVAKRHFCTKNLHDLVVHDFLDESEYEALLKGQNHLWRVRFALHMLTGRHDDRLLFDHQRTLASQLGYDSNSDSANLGVECFMQDYYRTVMELSRLNEMLLQHFQEAILLHNQLGDPIPINKRFQNHSGFLEVTNDKIFEHRPTALLELFLIMQENPELKGVRASTIRLVRQYRQLINDEFRCDIRAQSLFMEIMRQPKGVTHELRRMNIYGILAAYIPAFKAIVGRMQYDLFHVYTVDEHTLMVLRNLRRLTVPDFSNEHPFCSQLIPTLPKRELIYLAALFHDIAKGRGGDHSTLGAVDALEFCRQHHLSEYDSHLVSWLVRNHLLMSMTAQRKDITDPEVVQEFAAIVGDSNRLTYLYLLTFADSRATNPQGWNSWKDSLLRDLFIATRRALLRGLDNPLAQEDLIKAKQAEALQQLKEMAIADEAVMDIWQALPNEYFLTHSPNAIKRHTHAILSTPEHKLPLIAMRQTAKRGGTEVLYYGHDRDNLFAVTTTLLDQLGLSIVNARIMGTSTGKSLNSFLILEEDGSPVEPGHRSKEIMITLQQGLAQEGDSPLKVHRRMPRKNKHFSTHTRISFAKDPTHDRTAMRLITLDRPGLLSEIGQAFAACKIRLQHAKIATLGAEVEDIFFIADRNNRPLSDENQIECLKKAVFDRIPENEERQP